MDAYARAWSPVGSMLEDGARHRAPMTGSSVTEQCGRSDENVLISGDCGRADAIHGGRREVMRRTFARNRDTWACCCCDDPRRVRSESSSTFGSDERRASVESHARHARTLGSASLPLLATPITLSLHFIPLILHSDLLLSLSSLVHRISTQCPNASDEIQSLMSNIRLRSITSRSTAHSHPPSIQVWMLQLRQAQILP